mmetsp:Transcript_44731/g.127678  ORF Transcript_44731/g.127678 Transcript_44731/m.127678 type:complete len:325 (+) Transcript_44731:392-1366(+)
MPDTPCGCSCERMPGRAKMPSAAVMSSRSAPSCQPLEGTSLVVAQSADESSTGLSSGRSRRQVARSSLSALWRAGESASLLTCECLAKAQRRFAMPCAWISSRSRPERASSSADLAKSPSWQLPSRAKAQRVIESSWALKPRNALAAASPMAARESLDTLVRAVARAQIMFAMVTGFVSRSVARPLAKASAMGASRPLHCWERVVAKAQATMERLLVENSPTRCSTWSWAAAMSCQWGAWSLAKPQSTLASSNGLKSASQRSARSPILELSAGSSARSRAHDQQIVAAQRGWASSSRPSRCRWSRRFVCFSRAPMQGSGWPGWP